MVRLGKPGVRSLDYLRPELLHLVLQRLRALNENTRLLIRLLEESDWRDLGARALGHLRNRIVH